MAPPQPFTEAEMSEWSERGWTLARGALLGERLHFLTEIAVEASEWADLVEAGRPAPGLHHWEMTDNGPALARTEDLLDHDVRLPRLLRAGPLHEMASQLLGETAVLFKEKINYKHPGGAGFAPHQDATAYRFADHHVSCMVPLDRATLETGCLSVVSGRHHSSLPTDDRGCIADSLVAEMDWEPVEVEPGDILWFDSYTPHRSGSNSGSGSRRAWYLTYNAASAGDHRARYYEDKRAEFAAAGDTFDDERVRLSITGDFLGRPIRT